MTDLDIYMDRAGFFAREYRRLLAASQEMLDAMESLEAWEDDFGSRSINQRVWSARDGLKSAVTPETAEPHAVNA